MRIVGGQASGRRLAAPLGGKTRPTGAKVREALFDSLGVFVQDARVLDLYAGSGALGLEALSRGARALVLVEPDYRARQAILTNVGRLAMGPKVRLLAMTAESALRALTKEGADFDIVLCDPPWRLGLSDAVREGLNHVLAPEAIVVVEHDKRRPVGDLLGLRHLRTRTYGDTALSWYRRAGGGEEEPSGDGTGPKPKE